jgi:hypothetical protein
MTGPSSDKSADLSDLIEALRLLAAPAEVQVSVLPKWVALPDEVALTFFDAYEVLEPNLPDSLAPMLEHIAERINARDLSSEADQWDPETLARSEQWEDYRRLARSALTALNVPYQRPRLSGEYVRGTTIRDRMEDNAGA